MDIDIPELTKTQLEFVVDLWRCDNQEPGGYPRNVADALIGMEVINPNLTFTETGVRILDGELRRMGRYAR